MMNKYVKVIVAGCFSSLFVACSNDTAGDSPDMAGDGSVTFQVAGQVTRASDTQFEAGDAISVFASTAVDGTLRTTGNYADNVKYVYGASRFVNAGVGISVPKEAANNAHYYAVYPYAKSVASRFQFTIDEDQSSYEAYTKNDLCMAHSEAAPTQGLVALKFNHMLSRVLVDASALNLNPNNYRVELLAYSNSVEVDLQHQEVATASGSFTKVRMCEDGANHFKAILPPQTLSVQNVVGQLYIGKNLPISITIREDVELTSGTSVELKLRKSGDSYYFDYGGTGNSSIPDDSEADPNPEIGEPTTVIPNIQYTPEIDGNDLIIRIDMTGIQDPFTQAWIKLFGTRNPEQNIWISIDGQPKGFTVYNNSGEEDGNSIKTDIVFVVDNSGSMGQEADAVARDILSWSQQLASSGLDVRFACVGYSVSGTINGAIDFTNSTGLSTYLNRSSGTSRTIGFSGSNSSILSSAASAYRVNDECGAMAIRYANANLSFRSGANRIYVNFTDEPNQPNGKQAYSVEFFKDQNNWGTSQGTVHTVYSDPNTSFVEQLYYREYPWKISEYTGGTQFFTNSSFTGVNLSSLPITGALQHSYVIRLHNVAHLVDGKTHIIRITILSADRRVRADRVFYVVFTLP